MLAPRFTDLNFGTCDPLHDSGDNPRDFMRSYVDLQGSVADVVAGHRTRILGPKGTGKSALEVHLEKKSGADGSFFARMKSASPLPLAEIPHLKTGSTSGDHAHLQRVEFVLFANYLAIALHKGGHEVAPSARSGKFSQLFVSERHGQW